MKLCNVGLELQGSGSITTMLTSVSSAFGSVFKEVDALRLQCERSETELLASKQMTELAVVKCKEVKDSFGIKFVEVRIICTHTAFKNYK